MRWLFRAFQSIRRNPNLRRKDQLWEHLMWNNDNLVGEITMLMLCPHLLIIYFCWWYYHVIKRVFQSWFWSTNFPLLLFTTLLLMYLLILLFLYLLPWIHRLVIKVHDIFFEFINNLTSCASLSIPPMIFKYICVLSPLM